MTHDDDMLDETRQAYSMLDDDALRVLQAEFQLDPIRQRAIADILAERAKADDIEVRYSTLPSRDQEFDEIVARGASVHLEKMDENWFYLGIDTPSTQAKFAIRSIGGRIDADEYERGPQTHPVHSPCCAEVRSQSMARRLARQLLPHWRSMEAAPKPVRAATDPLMWVLLDHEDFVVPIFGYWDGHAWRDDRGQLVRREPRGWMAMPERVRP